MKEFTLTTDGQPVTFTADKAGLEKLKTFTEKQRRDLLCTREGFNFAEAIAYLVEKPSN